MKRINFVRLSFGAALLSMSCFSTVTAKMTITGTPPATVKAGTSYYFRPLVTHAIKGRLEFSYINIPSWSGRYRRTGAIIGTPTTPGVYANIVIQAWDGAHFAVSAPFTVTVTGGSSLPAHGLKISGTPATTATVGQYYSFTPTVIAPAGSSLSYQVANAPRWIQFNKSTGKLSGTPRGSDVSTDRGIVIAVSNGAETMVLPQFNIIVEPTTSASSGIAALSWSKPTVNTNGSPLTNLAGYTVRYGTNAQALSQQVSIGSPNSTGIEIQNLAPGNWYFEVAAVNTASIESSFSNVASKTIQ